MHSAFITLRFRRASNVLRRPSTRLTSFLKRGAHADRRSERRERLSQRQSRVISGPSYSVSLARRIWRCTKASTKLSRCNPISSCEIAIEIAARLRGVAEDRSDSLGEDAGGKGGCTMHACRGMQGKVNSLR